MKKNSSVLDTQNREWSFIGAENNNENTGEALSKNVQKETNIVIEKIELVSDNGYHARLTDENVNNIQRDELQFLNFFTLSEINNLNLSAPTKEFVERYGNLILS